MIYVRNLKTRASYHKHDLKTLIQIFMLPIHIMFIDQKKIFEIKFVAKRRLF